MTSTVIVDEHTIVRDGLRSLFSFDERFEVLGEAANGREAVTLIERVRPDVALMDLRMPGQSGVHAIAELTRKSIATRVLVLTTYDTDSDVLPAIEAGASGYLLKDAPKDELFRAVLETAEGRSVLAPTAAAKLMGRMRGSADRLSPREREVLELVASGASNRRVAEQLFVSEATVKTHLLHIYAKLGVNDRAAAVAVGFSRGYLLPRGE